MSCLFQAEKRADIAYLHSVLGETGIELVIKAVLENDGIPGIDRKEFSTYQWIPFSE